VFSRQPHGAGKAAIIIVLHRWLQLASAMRMTFPGLRDLSNTASKRAIGIQTWNLRRA